MDLLNQRTQSPYQSLWLNSFDDVDIDQKEPRSVMQQRFGYVGSIRLSAYCSSPGPSQADDSDKDEDAAGSVVVQTDPYLHLC